MGNLFSSIVKKKMMVFISAAEGKNYRRGNLFFYHLKVCPKEPLELWGNLDLC